jgi:uncharacterized membrane protein YczE
MDLASAAFWLFLSIVIGSLIWRKTLLQRERLATLRVAMEKDLKLDDALVQALLDASAPGRSRRTLVSRDFFLVVGVLLVATGLSLGVLALFAPEPRPLAALAITTEIVAGSLLVLWRILLGRGSASGNSSILS